MCKQNKKTKKSKGGEMLDATPSLHREIQPKHAHIEADKKNTDLVPFPLSPYLNC